MFEGVPEGGEIPPDQAVDQIETGYGLDIDSIVESAGYGKEVQLASQKIYQHDSQPEVRERNADQSNAHPCMVE